MGRAIQRDDDKVRLGEALRLAKAFEEIDDGTARRKILEIVEEAAKEAVRRKSP